MNRTYKLFALVIALTMLFSAVPCSFAGGMRENEVSGNPFMLEIERKTEVPEGYTGIYNASDLNGIRDNLSGKYILMNDVDLSEVEAWNPIGKENEPFTGELDGNGYFIKNINFELIQYNEIQNVVSLIAYADGAVIKNVGIDGVTVKGDIYGAYISLLVGEIKSCTIENCCSVSDISIETESLNLHYTGLFGKADYTPVVAETDDTGIGYCRNLGSVIVKAKGNDERQGAIFEIGAIGGNDLINCENSGSVTLDISGEYRGLDITCTGLGSACDLLECVNSGDVTVNIHDANFNYVLLHEAGLQSMGARQEHTSAGCKNTGNIVCNIKECLTRGCSTLHMGGLFAEYSYSSARLLANEGDISLNVNNVNRQEGIMLASDYDMNVYMGGLFGRFDSDGGESLRDSYNTGKLSVIAENNETMLVCAGGLSSVFSETTNSGGSYSYQMEIVDCFNTGNIVVDKVTTAQVGGIAGGVYMGFPSEINIGTFAKMYTSGRIEVEANNKNVASITPTISSGDDDGSPVIEAYSLYYKTDLPAFNIIGKHVIQENIKQLSDDEMHKRESFEGFDFLLIWNIDRDINWGYPYLRQFFEDDFDRPSLGDVTCDGIINTSDAVCVLKHTAGMITLSDNYFILGDVNRDGKVNTADATMILRYAAGIIGEFTINN